MLWYGARQLAALTLASSLRTSQGASKGPVVVHQNRLPYFSLGCRLHVIYTPAHSMVVLYQAIGNAVGFIQVLADNVGGLHFRDKRDRKSIPTEPSARLEDGTTRTDLDTTEYMQVVIYDHTSRRWA